ncbi:MAG: 30S ribosomal protein S24e [Candidatus Bathyarchaeota archaeon BA1]|nr:MAG: 30S ribosomal protein S24e [Candidatus Bathyarchaeota archaeon BA1]
MKIEIVSKKYNHLLRRREVSFEVNHEETGGTPPRFEVRKGLAAMLNADVELVYVRRMETKTGMMTAVGEANAYDSFEQAKLIEPEYVIARNAPPGKPKERGE